MGFSDEELALRQLKFDCERNTEGMASWGSRKSDDLRRSNVTQIRVFVGDKGWLEGGLGFGEVLHWSHGVCGVSELDIEVVMLAQ